MDFSWEEEPGERGTALSLALIDAQDGSSAIQGLWSASGGERFVSLWDSLRPFQSALGRRVDGLTRLVIRKVYSGEAIDSLLIEYVQNP